MIFREREKQTNIYLQSVAKTLPVFVHQCNKYDTSIPTSHIHIRLYVIRSF